MCSEYSMCSNLLFFIFTNLIQIKGKTHMPVTVRFPDHVFNENIFIVFTNGMFSWYTFSYSKSLLSLEKKRNLTARFSVKFMLPAQSIALANWFACVHACMSAMARVSLASLFIVFFYLPFGCPTANFGPLSRKQPHLLDVNHCILHFWPKAS